MHKTPGIAAVRTLGLSVSLFGLLLTLACASSALAAGDVNQATCPNEANTGFSSALPDCRAFEQVSPSFKNGFPFTLMNVLDGGERAEAESFGLVSGATSNYNCVPNQYDLSRTGKGWVTTAVLDLPQAQFAYATPTCTYPFVDSEGTSLLQIHPTSTSIYERDLYLHEPNGEFIPVGPMLPPSAVPPTPTGGGEPGGAPGTEFVAATPNFSHILFQLQALDERETNSAGTGTELWPGDTTRLGEPSDDINSLYEYVGTHNTTPSLVGVDNSGRLVGDCGTAAGGYGDGRGNRQNVMSSDGSRVFFTAVGLGEPHDEKCAGAERVPPVDELFARINGGRPQSPVDAQGHCLVAADACTVAISQPGALVSASFNEGCESEVCKQNTTDEANFRDANFEKASLDGSKVFFSSTQQLLDGASQDSDTEDSAVRRGARNKGCSATGGMGGCNLYEYDFDEPEGHHLMLVSDGDSSGLGPEVQGVAAISEDGSHVYFVAKGVLTQEPRGGISGECLASLTQQELEEEEAAKEGKCRPKRGANNLYVRNTVDGVTSFIATLSDSEAEGADSEQWKLDEGGRPMNVTDDGGYLTFTSTNHLTPADTSTVQQVFRYDSASGALLRISIGDQGSAGGIGGGLIYSTLYASTTAINRNAHPAMSEDGAVVVFASSEALTSQAFNNACVREESGRCLEYSQNIYEYKEGQLYLIGHGRGDPTINESGRDIFFETNESLAAQDTDTLGDIYDARVDGGFPATVSAAPCGGETCQGSSPPTPVFGAPASASVTGNGNLTPTTPVAVPKPKPKPRTLTRAKKLANALRICRKKRSRTVRASCEKQARAKYGAKTKVKIANLDRRATR